MLLANRASFLCACCLLAGASGEGLASGLSTLCSVGFFVTDIVLFAKTISAINAAKPSWEALMQTTTDTSGMYSCNGFDGPVNLFVPDNLTTWSEKYAPADDNATRLIVALPYEERVALAKKKHCTELSGNQKYFGLVYLSSDTDEPFPIEDMLEFRKHSFGLGIFGWVGLFIIVNGLGFAKLTREDTSARVLFALLECIMTLSLENQEQLLINMHLVSLNRDSFVNLSMPFAW